MPKYKYRFCDGSEKEIEVSDDLYALLKELDEQEKSNNLRYKRRNTSLTRHLQKEETADKKRDDDFNKS